MEWVYLSISLLKMGAGLKKNLNVSRVGRRVDLDSGRVVDGGNSRDEGTFRG